MRNQIKIQNTGERQLTLTIPQGMTGKQLVKWKAKNEAVLNSVKNDGPGACAVVSIGDTTEEGDRLRP